MRQVFIFGAGATRGTFPWSRHPVPSAAEFGAGLTSIAQRWHLELPALAKVVTEHLGRRRDDFSLEELWTCIDWHAKLKGALPRPNWTDSDAGRFGPEIKKALLLVYGTRCDTAASELPANATYTIGRLFTDRLGTDDLVASFNYDTVAERLAMNHFQHALRSVNSPRRVAGPTLAKPHGSVSWSMNPFTRTVRSFDNVGAPLLNSLTSADVDRNFEPLLLGAVPIKSELILEAQDRPGPNGTSWKSVFDTVLAQWKALVHALRQADRVVVVGYSFPREDTYGRFLFREATRARAIPRLEFFELEAHAGERAKEIHDTFGGQIRELVYCGRVTAHEAAA